MRLFSAKRTYLVAALLLIAITGCKRIAPPAPQGSESNRNELRQPQRVTEGSCFTADECPTVQYLCAPGFESFSDPSNPACACGCRPVQVDTGAESPTPVATPPAKNKEPQAPPQRTEEPAPAPQPISYQGTVLAGTVSKVLDFNKVDYDKALAAKKNIVLYFYANWCPICKREVPEFYSAFNALNAPNLIAFRVNYNDSDTDNDEVALARQFGVPYQHTKVFLKNGERVLKSPESWDKNRYLAEIKKSFE